MNEGFLADKKNFLEDEVVVRADGSAVYAWDSSEDLSFEDDDWEDLELDGRMTSLFHTLLGEYEVGRGTYQEEIETHLEKIMLTKPSVLKRSGLSNKEAERLALYSAGHEGAHKLFSNQEMMKNYVLDICSKWDMNYSKYAELLQMVEDLRVDHAVLHDRPGFGDLKADAGRALVRVFISKSPNADQAFYKALLSKVFGLEIRSGDFGKWEHVDWVTVEKIHNFIRENLSKIDSSGESAFFAYELYRGIYGNPPPAQAHDGEDVIGGAPIGKKTRKEFKEEKRALTERIVDRVLDPGIMEMMDPEKAEKLRQNMKRASKRNVMSITDLENMLNREMHFTEEAFGVQIITDEERKRLERLYATDIHAKVAIHVCDGVLSEKTSRRLYEQLKQQRSLTGQIEELVRRLRDSMLAATDKEEFMSEFGSVVPNQVWRATKCNNPKIFTKIDENKLGGFAIQILLDASGSQSLRTDEMRKVGYVLTEAITSLGIPLRVEGFCNSGTRMVLQRYRDYDDPRSENHRVTAYNALGDNRDSYAIRIAGYELLARPEENKIMIVVSDGAPNNVLNHFYAPYGAIINLSYTTGSAHDPGVKQAAIQVRELRRRGVALMGIYVGTPDERTLRAEKNTFGADFAYVRHPNRIVSASATYIEQQIKISVNRG